MSIDLKPFCADPANEPRYAICDPFVCGGYLYATDARMIVRVPSDLPDTERENLPAKRMAEFFGIGELVRERQAWPQLHTHSRRLICGCACSLECPDCGETIAAGYIHAEKDSLENCGEVRCEPQVCWNCDGAGKWVRWLPLLIPGAGPELWLNGQLVSRINRLPGPITYTVRQRPQNQGELFTEFTFAGGEGVVMNTVMSAETRAFLVEDRQALGLPA